MEDFIAEIYERSMVISNLKEFVSLLNMGCYSQARDLYNETARDLEKWLQSIAISDQVTASSIQDTALRIKDCYEDYCKCKGLVEATLISELYQCIKKSNTINVSEGKYKLISSETGFLTAQDYDLGLYLHSTYDPMNEAYQIINTLYKPEMETFMILGCGLGYEAYQVYHQSGGAVNICIYEEDPVILDYAALYGVLSLIPKDNIKIIHIAECEILARKFIDNLNSGPSCGYFISSSKKSIYRNVCDGELNRLTTNHTFDLETSRFSAINLWKNSRLDHKDFSTVIDMFDYDEWVVISAGPSLDYCISFLKKSKGHRGLIAVNTVLRRLLKEGIIPDIVAAADQYPELVNHIIGIEDHTKELILVADWLLNWRYASLFQGDICFVKTSASVNLINSKVSTESTWDISGTVASLALEAAVRIHAKRIYLVGQDLAYPSGQKYAKDMPKTETPDVIWETQVPSVDGGMVDTCDAFIWFRKALEYQIAKYDNIEFFNLSKHGAYIKGTKPLSDL